ncbi:hypothetical protein ACIRRH_41235 [Kitasatospora sp. NPDC101235]|uniref:hypothetical protein n=1 Tax=Kitasatospora sp. NPDC101235 TaxID=3364101 RepID=UPI00381678D1
MAERPHGFTRYVTDGCRCYTCGWARHQYQVRLNTLKANDQWQPYVDAAPARTHLQQLQAQGLGLRRIQELSGVDRASLQKILHGRSKIRPATARAILRTRPALNDYAPAAIIDATGTTRRLQALVAAGWPFAYLAARLGRTRGNFSSLLRRARVQAHTARAVCDLYVELWLTDPATRGADPEAMARARTCAASNDWAPPGAWDEDTIDDPAAAPDWTGACGTTAGYSAHQRAGTTTCPPCRAALAAYRANRKATAAA